MSITLQQTTQAAFPDRPNHDGVGLHATIGMGDMCSYLSHDLDVSHPVLHLRFMVCPWGIDGGRIMLLAGVNQQDNDVLHVSYDSSSRAVIASVPGLAEVSAVLDGVIRWQCVEVLFDSTVGTLVLWINGLLRAQVYADLTGLSVRSVCFGVVNKQASASGDLYLDELCLADEYIGPVVTPPVEPNAGDPARWLVVYNTDDEDAVYWAETYRQARGVPFANLLGLALPLSETIGASAYASLVDAIGDYLDTTGLRGQIMGVLLGYRVPGYVDFTGSGPLEAVPALLQSESLAAGTSANPNASTGTAQRLSFADLTGIRMTARLDAHDLSHADQLLSRSLSITSSGLGGTGSAIYFDPFVGDEPSYQPAIAAMLDWAMGAGGMRTRLAIVLSGDPAENQEARFSEVSNDGVFWGWSPARPNPDIFIDPPGRRAVSVQLHLEAATATTARAETPSNWADVPLHAGYAAAIASSRDNSIAAIPDAGAFFDALCAGWTLGEAWHVAQPLLRSGFYLLGDPLMSIAMPKDGIEVYGPYQKLEAMDPTSPCRILPCRVSSIDLTGNLPTENLLSHYVIRRSDSAGRLEASSTSIQLVYTDGVLRHPMRMPAWPDVEPWPVAKEDGCVRLTAWWCGCIRDAGIETIELLSQESGQAMLVAAAAEFDPLGSTVEVLLPIPPVGTRYRWRLTSHDGYTQYTALSQWVEPMPEPVLSLIPLGASA